MKKHLKNYFLPHDQNDHKPHAVREVSVILLALVLIGSFALATLQSHMMRSNAEYLAAVLPSVLIDLTNEDRAEAGLPTLRMNAQLTLAAQMKAQDMAEKEYFAHQSPDGQSPWYWIIQAGYTFTNAGENLAVNFADSKEVEDAWMDSPGHRENILNANFTEVGIATAKGEYQGRETVFVVQMFGSPAQPLPQPPAEPEPVDEEFAEVVSGEVAGTQANEEPTQSEPQSDRFVVTQEDDLFIEVQDTQQQPALNESEIEDEETDPQATTTVAGTEAPGLVPPQDQSSFWQRLLTQPRTLLSWLYIVFAAIMIFVLTGMVLVEIEKQHPRNVLYGMFLLALLMVLIYVSRHIIFGELLIV